MLARLSSADYPALAALKTRDDDDFSIALLDASSVMLDILTFYQERLANESYLRTAMQLPSLTELARLIGYQPAPGVGSSVYLSFTLQAAPGSPADPSTTAITIPKGTQVQSVPAQDQTPQTFETSADILAKADWSALPVQTGVPWIPKMGDLSVYLQGTATQLQPGDAILIVGDERRTRGQHRSALGPPHRHGRGDGYRRPNARTSRGARRWAMPRRASRRRARIRRSTRCASARRCSGYNAVNPLMLTATTRATLFLAGLLSGSEWKFGTTASGTNLATANLVDLDAVYPKLTVGGWLALIAPDGKASRSPSGDIILCLIESVTSLSRSDHAMSAKITRLAVDSQPDLGTYYKGTRSTSVLAQSEELAVAEQPLDHPLYGSFVDLKGARVDLAGCPGDRRVRQEPEARGEAGREFVVVRAR